MARFIVIGLRRPIGGYLRMSVEATDLEEAFAVAARRQQERGANSVNLEIKAVLEGPHGRVLWGSTNEVPPSFL